jgi:RNA polymerase sigma factor (sigma-70 family)
VSAWAEEFFRRFSFFAATGAVGVFSFLFERSLVVPSSSSMARSSDPIPMDDLAPTRWTLIERLKKTEDSRSWQDFFDNYWRLIYSAARKMGCTEAEAQDVVQETVISVFKSIPSLETKAERGSFKSWLLKITHRRIIDVLRKRPPAHVQRAPKADHESTTGPVNKVADPCGFGLEAYWEKEWKENLFQAALDRVKSEVTPRQFQIFYLLMAKGMSTSEVAKALRVSSAQVYLTKHRVGSLVKKIVKRLEKNS